MKNFNRLPLIAFLLVSLTIMDACQSSKSGTGSPLRFNLKKGKTYNFEMVVDIDQAMMGNKSKTSVMTSYTVNVLNENSDTKTLSFVYNDLKLDMDMMGTEIHVDPDMAVEGTDFEDMKTNPAALFNKVFRAMRGKEFIVTVDPEGMIKNVSGMEDMAKAIVDSLGLPESVREQALPAIQQQFNSSDFESQFMPIFYIFPNKVVGVGDSWEKSYDVKGKMPSKNSATYTVKQIEGNLVTLIVKNKIDSHQETMQVTGTSNGTMIVDKESGLVINSDTILDLTVITEGMTMTMTGKTKARGTEKH